MADGLDGAAPGRDAGVPPGLFAFSWPARRPAPVTRRPSKSKPETASFNFVSSMDLSPPSVKAITCAGYDPAIVTDALTVAMGTAPRMVEPASDGGTAAATSRADGTSAA